LIFDIKLTGKNEKDAAFFNGLEKEQLGKIFKATFTPVLANIMVDVVMIDFDCDSTGPKAWAKLTFQTSKEASRAQLLARVNGIIPESAMADVTIRPETQA